MCDPGTRASSSPCGEILGVADPPRGGLVYQDLEGGKLAGFAEHGKSVFAYNTAGLRCEITRIDGSKVAIVRIKAGSAS